MVNIPTFDNNMMDINDLFANLGNNWDKSSAVLYLLFGILFASYVAYRIKRHMKGGDK